MRNASAMLLFSFRDESYFLDIYLVMYMKNIKLTINIEK